MFAKNSIVVEPHATTKLLLSSQDQKFILRLVLPAVWEIRSENHRKKMEKASIQVTMSLVTSKITLYCWPGSYDHRTTAVVLIRTERC